MCVCLPACIHSSVFVFCAQSRAPTWANKQHLPAGGSGKVIAVPLLVLSAAVMEEKVSERRVFFVSEDDNKVIKQHAALHLRQKTGSLLHVDLTDQRVSVLMVQWKQCEWECYCVNGVSMDVSI